MHLTILRKILARVRVGAAHSNGYVHPLSAILANPKEYGYDTGDAAFDNLVDILTEMEEEAKHLDLITPPGNE